jgi:hypothetical protein
MWSEASQGVAMDVLKPLMGMKEDLGKHREAGNTGRHTNRLSALRIDIEP